MDFAKELVLRMRQKNKSHVGYGLQTESEALVGHILQNMAKSPMPSFKTDKKNEKDCLRYRDEGNQHFVAGDDQEAIISYTRSLAYANTHQLMANARANRSAALYRKKMYKECIIDIQAALELGYPEDKRKKLQERGLKAMTKLNQDKDKDREDSEDSKSDEDHQNGTNGIESLIITDSIENGDKKDISDVEIKQEDDQDKFIKPRYLLNPEVMSVPYGPSEEAPANSKGLSIKYSEEYGRHLVANQHFKPGEILTVEKPYCWVIYRDKFYTHCHHCLEKSSCLIPCSQCPIAQYCSEKCRSASWKLAHHIECPVVNVLLNLLNVEEDKIRMVMKIIRLMITVTSGGKNIDDLRKDMAIAEANLDNRTAGFTDAGCLESTSARSALSLATNMTTRPLIGISAFACISALTAMLLATQTKFFGKKYQLAELKDVDKVPDIKFCGSIMLRACVITSSNCFSIQPEPGIKVGSGLYVAHSLYNHSCAPNTFRHFEGLTMITRAMQPLNPGEQVFTGYGADYSYMPLAKRKEKLMEEYYFDCQCPACVNDWPTYATILEKHVGSIRKNKQLVDRLKPYKQRLLNNKYDIEAVKQVLEILYSEPTVAKPCEEILHAVQYLRCYYLGKLHKSK
ncbi:Similar to SMYD4: SET and MYND domain-containing protein 4 (Homo sapiens) [Cotesia congregata]|uniref:Similar to SMYD4: SET and MYND domain-containing protein 4 (Homo sapiens) n=1 Tax=Cotesia congregata TaxID=51543 RepID=A0A8J2H9R4_COTCN|nr:Similar to SMYD4: SET and MYND domain-containing protein 4 (Homo sapiens) [Cotesia congregata]